MLILIKRYQYLKETYSTDFVMSLSVKFSWVHELLNWHQLRQDLVGRSVYVTYYVILASSFSVNGKNYEYFKACIIVDTGKACQSKC